MSRTYMDSPPATRLRTRRSGSLYQPSKPAILLPKPRAATVSDSNPSTIKADLEEPAGDPGVTCYDSPMSTHHGTNTLSHDSSDISTPNHVHVRSPLTPVHNLVLNMKKRLEEQLGGRFGVPKPLEKNSPGLTRLRDTPVGQGLKERQNILEQMHNKAKAKVETVNVGGGVSLWPEMERMRLTQKETVTLCISSPILLIVTCFTFWSLHGRLLFNLAEYNTRLRSFSDTHTLEIEDGQESFERSVLSWHNSFSQLMNDLHDTFDVTSSSLVYKCYIMLYLSGIGTLMYYLADSILQKSKLSPRRIKIWVSLLVVVGCWTLLSLLMLFKAQNMELAVEISIHHLSEQLGSLVYTDLERSSFHDVLLYWRTRCLPPTTLGTLSILGVLPVRDVAYYMQYYSLPIITALLTPVVTLILSLKEIYSIKTQ